MDGERYCQKRGWLQAVPVLGWKWGIKALCRKMCNGWMQGNIPWALPGSAQQPGVAQQCLNPCQHWVPWESPGLGAPGMVGHQWVGGQAVGSKRATLLEKWVWVPGKGRLGAGCLIHGKKKKAPALETGRGNAATSLEGGGLRCHLVSASAGCETLSTG